MRFQHGLQSQALVGDSYFQEKLLLLTFDLLFHLLIEMLDFFIISSNFPAEIVKAESDEVYAKIYPTEESPGAWAPETHLELWVVVQVSQSCRISSSI